MTPDLFIQSVYYNATGFRLKGVKKTFPDLKQVVIYVLANYDNVSEEVEKLLYDKGNLTKLETTMRSGQLSPDKVAPGLLTFLNDFLLIITGPWGNEIWLRDKDNQISLLGPAHSQSIVEKTSLALLCDKRELEQQHLSKVYEEYRIGTEKPVSKKKWLSLNIETFFSNPVVSDKMPPLLKWGPLEKGDIALRVLDRRKLDHAIGLNSPIPHWNEILTRISDHKAFMAWTWSLFSGVCDTRQVCWIKGGGNDGKSTISNVYIKMLDSVACSFAQSNQNQFTGSKFFRKRLVSVPDVKNEKILENEFVFQVTGGDTIDIEFKGRDSFSSTVNAHFFMASNLSPAIDVYSKAYKSRLLYFKIKPVKLDSKDSESFSDSHFLDNLYGEMYPFLAQCKKVYESMDIKGARIPVSERMAKDIETECKHYVLPVIEEFCDFTLERKEGSYVDIKDLRTPFKKMLVSYSMPRLSGDYIKMLENYLDVKWGVEKRGTHLLNLTFKDDSDYEEA